MRKCLVVFSLLITVISIVSFTDGEEEAGGLRKLYSQAPGKWPAPFIDTGVQWKELGILPESPLHPKMDSLKDIIELGKALFFDTRLSGSRKISCATCHQPELSWTDGKERSIGHEGAINKRNSPTIQNSWYYDKLFWDGRAKDLQDQAFAPISSETEMHSDMPDVMRALRNIKGYRDLFKKAFGDDEINPDRMTEAIAVFEKTIVSRKSRFDLFLEGKKSALSNEELKGLHIFRTKAKCMNCHNGPMFSDNQFHKSIFGGNDAGLYSVTHKEEDRGKFKTPSLRDVMNTGPWGHNGVLKHMMDILPAYNKVSPSPVSKNTQMLYLTNKEVSSLLAFLSAISAPPVEFKKPVLPQ